MKRTIVLAAAHLLTDFITVFSLFCFLKGGAYSLEERVTIVLIYNICAFALQLPTGIAADKINNPKLILIISALLMGLGLSLAPISVYAMVIIMGLGNAFFHIGGGIEALQIEPGKAKYVGLFVGPGAVGLTLGTIFGKRESFHPFFLFILIGLLIVLFVFIPSSSKTKKKKDEESNEFKLSSSFPLLAAIIIFGAVYFRVVIGIASKYDYPSGVLSIVLISLAAFLGKSSGGFIADRFGWDRTVLISLIISAFMIAFKSGNIFLFAGGLFFFQIVMSVTLAGLNGILKNKSGLAFGLNCLAYFLGVLMKKTPLILFMRNQWIILSVIISLAVVLFLIFRNFRLKNSDFFSSLLKKGEI